MTSETLCWLLSANEIKVFFNFYTIFTVNYPWKLFNGSLLKFCVKVFLIYSLLNDHKDIFQHLSSIMDDKL